MSNIISRLKCNGCDHLYEGLYISFCHNKKPIKWKWQCDICGAKHIKIIGKYPDRHLNDIENKAEDFDYSTKELLDE